MCVCACVWFQDCKDDFGGDRPWLVPLCLRWSACLCGLNKSCFQKNIFLCHAFCQRDNNVNIEIGSGVAKFKRGDGYFHKIKAPPPATNGNYNSLLHCPRKNSPHFSWSTNSLPLINSARCCPVIFFFFLLFSLLLRGTWGVWRRGGVGRHGKGAEMRPRMFFKCSLTQSQPPASTMVTLAGDGNTRRTRRALHTQFSHRYSQPHGEFILKGDLALDSFGVRNWGCCFFFQVPFCCVLQTLKHWIQGKDKLEQEGNITKWTCPCSILTNTHFTFI